MDLTTGAALALAAGAVCTAWALRKFRTEQAHGRETADQHTRTLQELTTKIAKYLDEMTRQSERATQLVEAVDLSCARLDKLDVALRDHIARSEIAINDGVEELMGVALQLQDAVEQTSDAEINDVCPNSADGQHHLNLGECLWCRRAADETNVEQQAG